jgi:hypothetical protein
MNVENLARTYEFSDPLPTAALCVVGSVRSIQDLENERKYSGIFVDFMCLPTNPAWKKS